MHDLTVTMTLIGDLLAGRAPWVGDLEIPGHVAGLLEISLDAGGHLRGDRTRRVVALDGRRGAQHEGVGAVGE